MACAGSTVPPPLAGDAGQEERAASAPLGPRAPAGQESGSYRTPPRCPSEAEFFGHIARRLPLLSPNDVAVALAPSIDVDVTAGDSSASDPTGGGSDWVGRVSFPGADGPVSREVVGANCEEVVVALALIAALWLRSDDHARAVGAPRSSATAGLVPAAKSLTDAPSEDSSPSAESQSSAPSSHRGPAARSDGDIGSGRASVRDEAPVSQSPWTESRAPGAVEPRADADGASDIGSSNAPAEGSGELSDHRIQIAGMVAFASEPSGALGGRLQVERWGSAKVSSWSTALALTYAAGRHENERLGPATLRLLHGQLELCPPGLESSGVWVRACAHGRVGALHFAAATERVPDARSMWRPWAALGAGLHAGVPVSTSVSLRLFAELSIVLLRDEFATARPSAAGASSPPIVSTFYEISPVCLDVGLGAAHVF